MLCFLDKSFHADMSDFCDVIILVGMVKRYAES